MNTPQADGVRDVLALMVEEQMRCGGLQGSCCTGICSRWGGCARPPSAAAPGWSTSRPRTAQTSPSGSRCRLSGRSRPPRRAQHLTLSPRSLNFGDMTCMAAWSSTVGITRDSFHVAGYLLRLACSSQGKGWQWTCHEEGGVTYLLSCWQSMRN